MRTQGAATRRTGKPTKKQTMAAADVTCGLAEVLVFIGALVAGTACSLCSKVLLSMRSVGVNGEEQSFQNPLFQTWGMFLGMVFALPVHFAREALERRRSRRGYDAIGLDRRPSFKEMPRSTYLLLAAPALFDLAATALCMFGLTRVAVSVYQMLRGAAIVFVAILKHFVLKDKLAKYMWVGVGLNVVSIVLVGATAQSADSGQGDPLVGVALILAGAFVQSLQYAFEEKVMSSDVGAPPLLVIGMEGFWGLFVCTFVLYPAAYAAGVEDPYDTYVMFRNSQDIQRMFLLYFVAIFSYNLLAVLVTYMLDSVWHAILDNFRPISVWGVDLALFYVVTSGAFGEAWAYPGSYVQVAALGVLLYGTAVYNGSVKVPGCSYPPDAQPQLLSPMVVRASPALASSQVMKSPLIHGTPLSRRNTMERATLPRVQELPRGLPRPRSGSL